MLHRSARTHRLALVAVVLAVAAACNDDGRDMRDPALPLPPTTTAAPATMPPGEAVFTAPTLAPSFQLVAAWPNGSTIPARNTCDDIDIAPALSWTSVPAGTVELAITMTDIDADFTHWVMFAINPTLTGLAEGEIPVGGIQWPNDFGTVGWSGPCPPQGDPPHNYLFTVYALNQQLEVADDASTKELISILNQTAILQSSVSGMYARAG
jgi:Raf kinase inhibitor-like YbhB/YbcL family protein